MDQDVVPEAEREDTANKGNAYGEAPESSLAVHLVHESVVDQESECESAPGSNKEDSDLDDSDDAASCSETCQDCNCEDQPADPCLAIVQQESIVGNHKD
jgi:hypothetical protein